MALPRYGLPSVVIFMSMFEKWRWVSAGAFFLRISQVLEGLGYSSRILGLLLQRCPTIFAALGQIRLLLKHPHTIFVCSYRLAFL